MWLILELTHINLIALWKVHIIIWDNKLKKEESRLSKIDEKGNTQMAKF